MTETIESAAAGQAGGPHEKVARLIANRTELQNMKSPIAAARYELARAGDTKGAAKKVQEIAAINAEIDAIEIALKAAQEDAQRSDWRKQSIELRNAAAASVKALTEYGESVAEIDFHLEKISEIWLRADERCAAALAALRPVLSVGNRNGRRDISSDWVLSGAKVLSLVTASLKALTEKERRFEPLGAEFQRHVESTIENVCRQADYLADLVDRGEAKQ